MFIVSSIETIVSSFVNTVAIISTIGRIITNMLINITTFTSEFVSTISHGLMIFYEDVRTFISDMDYQYSHIIKMFNNGFNNSIDDMVRVTQSILSFITSTIERTKIETQNFFARTGDLFAFGVINLRDLLVLIGNSAWMLVMLLPNFTIFIIKGFVHILNEIFKKITALTTMSYLTVIESTKASIKYLASIPIQSFLGIIVLYLMIRQRWRIYRRTKFFLQLLFGSIVFLTIKAIQKIIRFGISVYLILHFIYIVIAETLRLQTYRQNFEVNEETAGNQSNDPDDKANLCIICYDQPKSIVLMPCRHLCLCRNCLNQLKAYRRECPVCRQTYRQTILVYS